MINYYSTKDTLKILGVCRKTLYNWSKSGKIKFITTPGGWRKYDLSYLDKKYMEENKKLIYVIVEYHQIVKKRI